MVKPVLVLSAYGERELEVGALACEPGFGKAKQSFKDECDVNLIVKRFSLTGELPSGQISSPVFGNVSGLDFQEMMDIIARAGESFAALPAELRARFANDPREFVGFCSDEANAEEMVRMGLREPVPFKEGQSPDRRAVRPVAAVLVAPVAPLTPG